MGDDRDFLSLEAFLKRVPGIRFPIGTGKGEDGHWWVKFAIDIGHRLAWNVVQEFGFVLNYVSVNERLPTTFMPVSPPPYLNGGPDEHLSWVIACHDPNFKPGSVAKWLEERLPRPVEDPNPLPLRGRGDSNLQAAQPRSLFRKFCRRGERGYSGELDLAPRYNATLTRIEVLPT